MQAPSGREQGGGRSEGQLAKGAKRSLAQMPLPRPCSLLSFVLSGAAPRLLHARQQRAGPASVTSRRRPGSHARARQAAGKASTEGWAVRTHRTSFARSIGLALSWTATRAAASQISSKPLETESCRSAPGRAHLIATPGGSCSSCCSKISLRRKHGADGRSISGDPKWSSRGPCTHRRPPRVRRRVQLTPAATVRHAGVASDVIGGPRACASKGRGV